MSHRMSVRRLHLRIRLRQVQLDLTRVPPEEPGHGEEHQHAVEDVQRPLIAQQIALRTTDVLDDTEDIPHHDECRGDIQHVQRLLPGNMSPSPSLSVASESDVEVQRRDDEDGKHDDLQDQAADDDILARLHPVPFDH